MHTGKKLGRPLGKRPDKKELERLYVNEKKSVREVSKLIGCSKDKIYRLLKEYGIELRKRGRLPGKKPSREEL